MIIDRGRALGYCFGKVDRSGQVVADRYVSSGKPIPQATNPVPYNFLERAGTPPGQWFVAPDGLGIDATHSPAVFTQRRHGHDHDQRQQPAGHAERPRSGGRLDGDGLRRDPDRPDGDVDRRSGLDVLGLEDALVHPHGHARAARGVPADHDRR